MNIQTGHFGEISIEEDKIISFPKGLIGFESARSFSLIQDPKFAPFYWLQSVDRPELTLVTIAATLVRPDYHLPLSPADKDFLQLADKDHLAILAVAVIKDVFEQSTLNLLAPVVINERARLGCQVINEREDYRTRHVLKDEMQDPAKEGKNHAGADAQEKAIIDARG